jgi:hypothetical protein
VVPASMAHGGGEVPPRARNTNPFIGTTASLCTPTVAEASTGFKTSAFASVAGGGVATDRPLDNNVLGGRRVRTRHVAGTDFNTPWCARCLGKTWTRTPRVAGATLHGARAGAPDTLAGATLSLIHLALFENEFLQKFE